eukprot:1333653-Amorphochlora_amoeboformis.AAC.1
MHRVCAVPSTIEGDCPASAPPTTTTALRDTKNTDVLVVGGFDRYADSFRVHVSEGSTADLPVDYGDVE